MCKTATNDKPSELMQYIMLALLALMFLTLFICLAMDAWSKYKYRQVLSTEDFGRITSATYNTTFSNTKTAIQTEKGTLLVDGALQAINGHQVQVEQRANGDKALCVIERNVCKRILGD